MAGLFFQWLYLDAPSTYLKNIQAVIAALYNYFSIPLLIPTLFSPWRHDAIPLYRLPLNMWFQAIAQNSTSRLIGFSVRSFTILLGLFAISIYVVGSVVFLVAWYFLPILCLISIYYGLLLLGGVYG